MRHPGSIVAGRRGRPRHREERLALGGTAFGAAHHADRQRRLASRTPRRRPPRPAPTRRVSSSTAHARKPVRAAIASGPVSVSASGVAPASRRKTALTNPLRTARHEIDRRGDGRVRWDAGAAVGRPRAAGRAAPRPASRGRAAGSPRCSIAASSGSRRRSVPKRELGRERAVTQRSRPERANKRRQEPVRVRAVVDHAADHLEGDRPRGGRGHPRRSPSANRTPRAHADASIRLRPAGATSTSRTPPPPARTSTPRSSTPDDRARGAVAALVIDRRGEDLHVALRAALVAAPGRGERARTQRTISSGGRSQSIRRSSAPIVGA